MTVVKLASLSVNIYEKNLDKYLTRDGTRLPCLSFDIDTLVLENSYDS